MHAYLVQLFGLLAGGTSALNIPAILKRQNSYNNNGAAGYIETLPDETISLVKARLQESAHGSWENGTRAQALLEYDYPVLSVFYDPSIPIVAGYVPDEVNAIAQYTMRNRPSDTLMFCEDGSAGDPASLGISILLANHTISDVNYMPAVNDQNRYLFQVAPRTSDGAVSHRVSEVQLWSDNVAMVPPYLAYYGALTSNNTFTQAAYDQCRLYRQYLNNGTGLYQHIVMGQERMRDYGFWATGNAWVVWGQLRVLATLMHAQSTSNEMEQQKENLRTWTLETLKASYQSLDQSTGLLPNYLGTSTFPEASSTALMAATSYRLAQLGIDTSTLADADRARHAVFSRIDSSTGWLAPVVDPLDWSREGAESAEGQAFTLLLAASYRDYLNATGQTAPPNGGTGNTGLASRSVKSSSLAIVLTFAILAASTPF